MTLNRNEENMKMIIINVILFKLNFEFLRELMGLKEHFSDIVKTVSMQSFDKRKKMEGEERMT